MPVAPGPDVRLERAIRRHGGAEWVESNMKRRVLTRVGGGGGGSGVGPAGVAFETGVQSGDGVVTITYDPDAGSCPAAAAAIAVIVEPRFTG
jgi:hypothetical protein